MIYETTKGPNTRLLAVTEINACKVYKPSSGRKAQTWGIAIGFYIMFILFKS